MSTVVCGATMRWTRVFRDCWGACGIQDAPVVKTLLWSPYYGADFTCTVCGDSWCPADGWLYERPFQRGWRQKAISASVEHWDTGCDCPEKRDEDWYLLPCEHQEQVVV